MFRRAVGSLLARRFSPRATPRTAPARSLHSLRDFTIGDGLLCACTFAAAVLAGGGGALAVGHFMKPDMKARFELWIVKNNKTYRDEEEKAMRFQLFKDTVERIEESEPLSFQGASIQRINYFADYTEQERRCLLAFPDGIDKTDYYEMVKSDWAKQEKGT